ncbi:MAG: tetratricopeptide repeat protein [Candidatus Obscuribacterales bacterium]
MKLLQMLAALTAIALFSVPVLAEGRPFPGKGEEAKWSQACVPFNQGITFYRAGNYPKAIEKYKEAIAIYPHDYDFYNNLGLTYKKNNELDLAAEALKKSIELKPNVWESWSNLGSVYKHQKKAKEAVDAFSKALQYNPPANKKTLIMQNLNAMKVEEAQTAVAKDTSSEVGAAASGSAAPRGAASTSVPAASVSSSSSSASPSPGAPPAMAPAAKPAASDPVPIAH